ncbi:MAG: molecular chaperone HtpG [Planctomycetaceae bacterium]|nr:molecular chaperone HtpG [Planctomycetaceae bacterium]
MTETNQTEQFTFQAEIKELLTLLSHSLYQNREITIRELVSNASDALDKMRFQLVANGDTDENETLEIAITPDEEVKTLTIADTGVGMTRDELVKNLGTIAHSGSKEFLSKLSQEKQPDVSLIGQFGVGFYSAFMLADTVEVLTRSFSEDSGWCWESEGTGQFTIEPRAGLERGTQIVLHLKEEATEFSRPERLQHILQTYSTFVAHPIKLDGEQVNTQPPIWVEPKSHLKEEQYHEFYKYLTHGTGGEKPRWYLHLASETPFEFKSILFCPESNFEKLGFGKIDHGLYLCAKRILVQNDCDKLLPEYLRFLYGLVDSADLPLNVSREALQDNTVFMKIRKVITKKALDHLTDMQAEQTQDYHAFYQEFGSILREGISSDFGNRDRLSKLLLFPSAKSENESGLTSLTEYCNRMAEDQEQIYFLSGQSKERLERNPHLEAFRKQDLEVLLLVDPVNEIVLSQLEKFDGKEIVSIDSADVKLPDSSSDDSASDDKDDKESVPAGFEALLEFFEKALDGRVAEVRQSDRLTESPCCLVNKDGKMSTQLQKVLSMQHEGFPMAERILELNPQAPLIQRLSTLVSNEQNHQFISNCASTLLDQALLQEGISPDDDDMPQRVLSMMQELADGKTSIVT